MNNYRSSGLAFVFVGLLMAFEALVVRFIWNWHVVPVFHTRILGFGHALGLVCLVAVIKYRVSEPNADPYGRILSDSTRRFAHEVLLFVFLLLLAWIGLQVGSKG